MSEPAKRVTFDPTINLGHILTAITFLVVAAGGWVTMDSRVSALERESLSLRARDDSQAKDSKEAVVGAETRLLTRINDERSRVNETTVRIGEDIREMKQIMRDGFRDFEVKLDKKADRPGR